MVTVSYSRQLSKIYNRIFLYSIIIKNYIFEYSYCIRFTSAVITENLAFEVARRKLHELAVDAFFAFDKDPRAQQQILWLHGSLLAWPKSRIRTQSSKVCMNFYKKVLDTRENLLKVKTGKVQITVIKQLVI